MGAVVREFLDRHRAAKIGRRQPRRSPVPVARVGRIARPADLQPETVALAEFGVRVSRREARRGSRRRRARSSCRVRPWRVAVDPDDAVGEVVRGAARMDVDEPADEVRARSRERHVELRAHLPREPDRRRDRAATRRPAGRSTSPGAAGRAGRAARTPRSSSCGRRAPQRRARIVHEDVREAASGGAETSRPSPPDLVWRARRSPGTAAPRARAAAASRPPPPMRSRSGRTPARAARSSGRPRSQCSKNAQLQLVDAAAGGGPKSRSPTVAAQARAPTARARGAGAPGRGRRGVR